LIGSNKSTWKRWQQLTDNPDRTDTKAGLGNKYIMACVIAKRARYLSEKKGRELEENIGNPIFLAMKEIEQGKIKFTNTHTYFLCLNPKTFL